MTVLAGSLTLLVIVALGVQQWRSFQYISVLKDKHIPAAELSTTIVHINDVLTDSAYLSVLTGFPRWQSRYEKYKPALNFSTDKFAEMVTGSVEPVVVDRLRNTRKALFTIEENALGLGHEKLEQGFALLDSAEYQNLRDSYNKTVYDIVGLFARERRESLASQHTLAKFTVAGFLISFIVLIFTWVYLVRLIRSYENHRQKMYSQLSQAAKLTSLGTLSSGVAHELRNPLTIVKGLAQQLELETEMSPALRDQAKQIVEEATRIEVITDHLRSFAREGAGKEWGYLDLNQAIEHSLTLLQQQLKSRNISLQLDLSENLPKVWGELGSIESVFQNLVANSRDAFVALPETGNHQITIESKMGTAGTVTVAIKDNAGGISDEIKSQLFDPFFSTKGGKGTGLGLSIVHGIMEQHKGNVEVASKVGEGATFTLTFKTSEPSSLAQPAKAA